MERTRALIDAIKKFDSSRTSPIFVLLLSVLAVTVMVILASVQYSLVQVDAALDQITRAEHAGRVLFSSTTLLSTIKDAETGQRGFVITGSTPYLERYEQGAKQSELELERLTSLVADDPNQLALVDQARALLSAKLTELRSTVEAEQSGKHDAAVAIVRSGEGNRVMDELRTILNSMNTQLQDVLTARAKEIAPQIAALRAGILGGGVLLILLLVILGMLAFDLSRERATLSRSRDLFAVTLSSIGDGVIVTDAAGNITFMNPEAERLTGWTSKSAATRPLREVFHIINESTRQAAESPVEKVLRFGTVVGLANHTILIARNGTETPIDDSAAPIRARNDDRIFGVVLCFRDFSEQKAVARELVEQQRVLETRVAERTQDLLKAQERIRVSDRMATVGALAAGLAHDMNNVLLPLSIQTSSLLSTPELSADLRSGLSAVVTMVDHLRQMARNLSLFAHDPEQEGSVGRTNLASWQARVKPLIDTAVVGKSTQTPLNIQITWEIADNLPAVKIAPHRLTQAVINLVHNARDTIIAAQTGSPASFDDAAASEHGQITIAARATPDQRAVIISVSDDGSGMDETTRLRCTEAFFTTKNMGGAGGLGGSGLGLALVHTITQRVSGTLEIQSQPGHGSTFAMTLPIAVSSQPVNIARTANITIRDNRTRMIVAQVLEALMVDFNHAAPAPDSGSELWITDAQHATPAEAAEFLRAHAGRRVVTLGGDQHWQAAGAIVCELKPSLSQLRSMLTQPIP